jgi:type IV pilus assembly protein PilF
MGLTMLRERQRPIANSSIAAMARRITTAVLLVAGTCSVVACGRLAFVKPDVSRGSFQRVAPEVSIAPSRGDEHARILAARAGARLHEGDTAEALRLASEAVRRDPDSADAQAVLAFALERSGSPEQAGVHYRRAAELAPSRGEMLNNYGAWLCGQRRPGESLKWFDAALAIPGYPTPAAALANAGACAYGAGEAERAERDLRRAIAVDPENPLALATLARLAYDRGRWMEARAFSQRRLAAAPADIEALQVASQIEQKLGDSDAARRYGERMQKEFPAMGNFRTGEVEGR